MRQWEVKHSICAAISYARNGIYDNTRFYFPHSNTHELFINGTNYDFWAVPISNGKLAIQIIEQYFQPDFSSPNQWWQIKSFIQEKIQSYYIDPHLEG